LTRSGADFVAGLTPLRRQRRHDSMTTSRTTSSPSTGRSVTNFSQTLPTVRM
jgi:hypothetical protein